MHASTPIPPDVSILIVSWNAATHLERCLASLDSHRHEIIVIDNASTDGSADRAEHIAPEAVILRQPRNVGFAGAVNIGAARARGRYVLLLNPDVCAQPGSIDRLTDLLDRHAEQAATAGRLVGQDGATQVGFNVRRFPTLATWAVDLLLIDKLWPANPITRRYLALDLNLSQRQEVDQPAAACVMIRRDAFSAVGGMDECFFPAWFEDVDFCWRLRQAGWRIGYTPDASFTHEGGVAMNALGLRAFSRVWYRNLLRYADKHHGIGARLTLRPLITVGMLLRAMVSLISGRPQDARAYLGVLRDVVARSLSGGSRKRRPDL